MKIFFRITIVVLIFLQTLSASIEIRQAQIDDLDKVIALDYEVSMEFFKPMYETCYSDTIMGQRAEENLKKEVKADYDFFKKVIESKDDKQILVIAVDTDLSKYCGLILCEKVEEKTVEIALLLVAKNYRNCRIGKKLIKTALSMYGGISRCQVYPFQSKNEATLLFYEKLGFKRIGKASSDRKNSYGIAYDQLYFEYVLDEDGIQQLIK